VPPSPFAPIPMPLPSRSFRSSDALLLLHPVQFACPYLYECRE
jgi:hypothetical protein